MTNLLDRFMDRSSRELARRMSRRSFVARLGAVVAGGAAIPLLPVARAAAEAARPEPDGSTPPGDPTSCEYWRHCAIDGFACSCCGGTQTLCPPGSELSLVTWIGTCRNPSDDREYVISYNDCCGKSSCGRCLCNRNEGDHPMYDPPRSNDINWCQGTKSNVYHCTISAVLGEA